MTILSPSDPFWDELGIEWTAIQPKGAVIASRLQARVRRQSNLINGALIVGLLAAVGAALMSAYCIWIGWHTGAWNFVLRGVAFAAIVVIVSLAVSALLRVRGDDGLLSLSKMLNLAIARSRKALWITRLGFAACGITALLGLAGTAVRTHLSRPPALSPFVDLALLAVLAIALFLYGRYVQSDLRKYTQLKQILVEEWEQQ
jgi:membrane protein implicated in regulation of membrane protease activity